MILTIIGRGAQFVLMFITIKISTTVLHPVEMAKVILFTSITGLFSMILIYPVGMFMNRRIFAWNEESRIKQYYNYFWCYLVVICGLAIASLWQFISAGWINTHTTMAWALFLVGGSLLFSTINQTVIPGLNSLGYRRWFFSLTLATAATGLATASTFVLVMTPRAESWICGLIVGQLIFAAIGWVIFMKKIKISDSFIKPTMLQLKLVYSFSWPISIAVGFGWLQSQSYRIIMESSLGLHALGLFATGYGISVGIISACESVFLIYLQPAFYKRITNGNLIEQSNAWNEYSGTMLPSLVLVGFFVVATSSEISKILLGTQYLSSSEFIVWGALSDLARVSTGMYGMIAHARMKTNLLLIPSIVGASLSLFLIWMLIPMFGSHGVGAGLVISSAIGFALTYLSTRHELQTSLSKINLITGIIMGLVLILTMKTLGLILNDEMDIILITMIKLTAASVLFFYFQIRLLRPLLFRQKLNNTAPV